MQIKKFTDNTAWEQARLGKITGSKLKDILTKRGYGKKIGYYQLIADRLAIPSDGENAMDRGLRLEEEVIEMFVAETKKEIDSGLVIWSRDDNDNIAISPDGYTEDLREAVEIKCLGSAYHIEALLTQSVPKNYEDQILQYFVVNDQLERVYMVFYDPRLLTKQFFYLTIERNQKKVEEYLALERQILSEVNEIVSKLSEL